MISLREVFHRQFADQLRYLAADTSGRVFLAGGNNPITGRRSEFSASLCCLDPGSGSIVWNHSLAGNRAFCGIATSREVVIAFLEFNFARKQSGLFSFDLATGSQKPVFASDGINGLAVYAPTSHVYCSALFGGNAIIFALDEDHNVRAQIRFDQDSQQRALCNVQPIDRHRFIAVFDCIHSYSYELWTFTETQPVWTFESKNNRCFLHHERLMTFSSGDGTKEIGSIDIATGRNTVLGTVDGAGLSSLAVIDEHTVVWINHDRQIGSTDLVANKSSVLLELNADCPGWTDLLVLPGTTRVVALNANSHTNPGTELSVYDAT
jgi:outer membrane protein assembly factor BamB